MVIDGPKKIIDFTKTKVSVKTEIFEEDENSIDRLNDTSSTPPKTKSRKRKTPISSEYVDVTFDSEYSSTNSDYSPGECLEFIRSTLSNPAKATKMMKIIEGWTEEDQPNIFLANNIEGTTEARKNFIKKKQQEMIDLKFDILSIEFNLIRMLMMNPISGWKLLQYLAITVHENINDIAHNINQLYGNSDGNIVKKLSGFSFTDTTSSNSDKCLSNSPLFLDDSGANNNLLPGVSPRNHNPPCHGSSI